MISKMQMIGLNFLLSHSIFDETLENNRKNIFQQFKTIKFL